MLLGLLPFLLLEFVLVGLGLPNSPPPADPYVDLHNLRPLFQLDPEQSRLEISPERLNLFRPTAFPVDKSANTFRIFALGGSTTQGEPYSTETAFPEWLRLSLQAATRDDAQHVEVINCGGLSYASYRVLAILREVLNYQPDLIVIYTGHNEYLEYRTYAGYREPNTTQQWLALVGNLRTVQLTRQLTGQIAGRSDALLEDRTELKSEVDALLDYQGGLADYHRGAAWYQPIPAHFRWNLARMIEACQLKSVPVVLVRPVSNLVDCPPMKFELEPQLSTQDCERFEHLWSGAREADATLTQSLEQVTAALKIDPQHAGANYLLGQLQFSAGDFVEALDSLRRAKDYDVCPLRAPTAIGDAVTELAVEYHVPLLDAEALFAERSPDGLVGQRWLVDHIHPNLDGHQLLGQELAQLCFDHGIVPAPVGDWPSRCHALFAEHLSHLNEAYFQRGKQRLAGLLLWTQGRAKKIRGGVE